MNITICIIIRFVILTNLDNFGNCILQYKYDAWGVCSIASDTLSNSIGTLNPFRYRGYYFDTETELYYLQSRYYDPWLRRFISSDDSCMLTENQDTIVQYNLFAYCGNSPIINIDPTGYGKTCVIYYYASRGTLDHFAAKSGYFSYYSSQVERHCVYSASQFVSCWNNLKGKIDTVFLYLHGDPGQLNFQKGKDILGFKKGGKYNKYYSLYDLKKKNIDNGIVLLSCYGAKKGKNGKSVASFLHERNKCTVIACTGGVNYTSLGGNKYYAASSVNPKKFGKWISMYYGKRFIWFGKKVSKQTAGFSGILYL